MDELNTTQTPDPVFPQAEQKAPTPVFPTVVPPAPAPYSEAQLGTTTALAAMAIQRNASVDASQPQKDVATLVEEAKQRILAGREDQLREQIAESKRITDWNIESQVQQDILSNPLFSSPDRAGPLRQSMERQVEAEGRPVDYHALEKEGVAELQFQGTQDHTQAVVQQQVLHTKPDLINQVNDHLTFATVWNREVDRVRQEVANESWGEWIADFFALPLQTAWATAHAVPGTPHAFTPGGELANQFNQLQKLSHNEQLAAIPGIIQSVKDNSGLLTPNLGLTLNVLESLNHATLRDRMAANTWAFVDIGANIGLAKYLTKPFELMVAAGDRAGAVDAVAADVQRAVNGQAPERSIGGVRQIHTGADMLTASIPGQFQMAAMFGPGIANSVAQRIDDSMNAVADVIKRIGRTSRLSAEQVNEALPEAAAALSRRLNEARVINTAREGFVFENSILPEDIEAAKGKGSISLVSDGNVSFTSRNDPLHFFRVHDASGDTGVRLSLVHQTDTQNLHVETLFGPGGTTTPTKLGFRAVRDLLYTLKEQFPDAKTIDGFRIGGARRVSGNGAADSMRMPLPERPVIQPESLFEHELDPDTGLHYLSAYVGDYRGYGGTSTKELVDLAIQERGWDPKYVQAVEMPDGQWAAKVTQVIREDGVMTPMMTSPERAWGRIAQFAKNANDMRDEYFQGAALRQTGVEAAMWNRVMRPLIARVTAVSNRSRKALQAVIDIGNQTLLEGETEPGTWFNQTDFNIHFERVTGRSPTEKEAVAYYTLKQMGDIDHYLRNRGLFVEKARRGVKTVSVKNDAIGLDTGRVNGHDVSDSEALGNVRFLDADTGQQWAPGKAGDFQQRLDAGTHRLIRLESPIQDGVGSQVKGQTVPYKYVLAHKDMTTVNELEYQQLKYVGGTRNQYSGRFYTKQAQSYVIDGVKHWLNPLTHAVHMTEKGAQTYAGNLEAARQLYNKLEQGVPTGMSLADAEMVFARSIAHSYENFDALVKAGQISKEHPFESVIEDQNPLAMANKEGTQWFDPDMTSTEQLYLTRKGMYYSPRGTRLLDEGGKLAPVIDPWRTTQMALSNSIRTFAWQDYNFRVMEDWIRKAVSAGLIPNDAAARRLSTTQRFLQSKLDSNLVRSTPEMQLLSAHLEMNKTLHKRLLNMETTEQATENMKARRFAYWISGHGQVSDNIAAGVMNLQDKRPLAALKALAYNTTIAMFAPARFVIHSTTAAAALTVHPQYGLNAAVMTWPIRLLGVNNEGSLLDHIANWGKPLTGFEPASFRKMVTALNDTGRMYMGDATSMLEDAYPGKIGGGYVQRGLGAVARGGQVFFNEAERINQIVGWQIAWRDALDQLPGVEEGSEKFTDYVLRKADQLTNSMSAASRAGWQKNPILGLTGQFHTLQARLMERMLPKELGGNQMMSGAQRARLIVGQLAMYGSAGAPGLYYLTKYAGEQYQKATGEQLSPELWRTMSQGLIDESFFHLTGGKLDTDWAARVGIGSTLSDFANGNNQSIWETFGGPSFEVGGRMTNSILSVMQVLQAGMGKGEMNEQDFDLISQELLKNLPLFNEGEKAWYIFKTGQLKNPQTGKPMVALDKLNAFAAALGVPIRADVKYWEFQRDLEGFDQLVRKHAQQTEKIEQNAYDYLRQGQYPQAKNEFTLLRWMMAVFSDDATTIRDIAQERQKIAKRGADGYNQLIMEIYNRTGQRPLGEQ